MIAGSGTDIIETVRLRNLIERYGDGFLRRWFSASEIAYCSIKKKPWLHFAARLAAKESVQKALGIPLRWREISVEIRADGSPKLVFYGSARESVEKLALSAIHVSLSHCDTFATAVVIAESKDAPSVRIHAPDR